MKKYYDLDIIWVLIKKKEYVRAIQTAWLIFSAKLLPGRRLIYRQHPMPFTPQSSDSDFQVLRFSSAHVCKAQLGAMHTDNRSLKFSLEECTSKGRVLWVGIKNGIAVSVACTSQAKIANYFFELKDNEVAISRCETHPAYRGSGLYARTLQVIMSELARQGIESFYIDCFEWNWPSSRGIEKAGFKLIGYGWDKKGKLSFKPLSQLNNGL